MPTTSPFPSVEIPECDIWSLIFDRDDGIIPEQKKIYIDAQTSRSYNLPEARETAAKIGNFLKSEWNWRKGDVLAFFTPNSIDTPSTVWGCHWAGGVVTTANLAYTVDELTFQLKDSTAKAIVTQASLLPVAIKALSAAGISKERILLVGDETSDGFVHLSTICSTFEDSQGDRQPNKSSDLAFLVYSSGTTGRPKGVMLSHRNIVSNILMLQHESGKMSSENPECTMIDFLPFYHIYGLVRLVHDPIYYGISAIVMDKFELNTFCRLVQEYKVNFVHAVPPVLLLLAKHPVVSKYDLSSLQMMSSGAAPLSWDLAQAVYERIRVPVKQAYGLSETSPTTHSQQWGEWSKHPGSVGKLLPNQKAIYLNPDGEEVPPGSMGELCISGPNVFQGYWKSKDATERAVTGEGFFKTGDIGYEDSDGNLFITDRAKELIKYKGFQVAPAELEGYLVGHPKVADACVVGVWTEEQATELPRAYVVLASSSKLGRATDKGQLAREISDWITAKVAHHKRLRGGVRFLDVVPRNPSGKILRRVLRDQAASEEKKRTAPKL